MPFSHDVERALRAAFAAHAEQTRKGEPTPYVTHPVHVALILARVGADEATLQAALLHDVVEDCDDWTLERVEAEFGPDVRAIVDDLTEDKDRSWEDRKGAAVDHVPRMRQESLAIKAADKLHNLRTLVARLDAADDPSDVWDHFSRGPAQTHALAVRLVAALRGRVDPRLGDGLVEALAGLARHL